MVPPPLRHLAWLATLASSAIACGHERREEPGQAASRASVSAESTAASRAPASGSTGDPRPRGPAEWRDVGAGVSYRAMGAGPEVAILFAGFEADGANARAWGDALFAARLGALGVGHLYAVRGPDHPQYKGSRLDTTGLAAHLEPLAGQAGTIVVAAHSSGSFVAHELLRRVARSSDVARGKIVYFNLDGAGGGLTPKARLALRRAYFVYAKDGARLSRNADVMRAHAGDGCTPLPVDASAARCPGDATWCLHASLLVMPAERPGRAWGASAAELYGSLASGAPPCTAWLDGAGLARR